MSKMRLGSMLRHRGVWPAIEDELARLGVRDYALGMGGKHPFVRITIGDRSKRIAFAGTPASSPWATKNAVRTVRRIVAAMRED